MGKSRFRDAGRRVVARIQTITQLGCLKNSNHFLDRPLMSLGPLNRSLKINRGRNGAHEVSSSGLGSVNHCPSGHYRAHDRNQRSFLLLCASSTFPARETAERTAEAFRSLKFEKAPPSIPSRSAHPGFGLRGTLWCFFVKIALVLDDVVVQEAS